MTDCFDEIAPYYEWILPDEALTGARVVEMTAGLARPGGRLMSVLDCACGIGADAVALAAAGHRVVATDASHAMVERTRQRAATAGANVEVHLSRWQNLPSSLAAEEFDIVFCLGNSLVQNENDQALNAAVVAMQTMLAPAGYLVIDSRNWELLRVQKREPHCAVELIERHGNRCVSVRTWTIPERWDEMHMVNIALTLIGQDGSLSPMQFRIQSFPIPHERILEKLVQAGLRIVSDDYDAQREWYTVVSQRSLRTG